MSNNFFVVNFSIKCDIFTCASDFVPITYLMQFWKSFLKEWLATQEHPLCLAGRVLCMSTFLGFFTQKYVEFWTRNTHFKVKCYLDPRAGIEHPLGAAGCVLSCFLCLGCWLFSCALSTIAIGALKFMNHVPLGPWVTPRNGFVHVKFTENHDFGFWTAFSRPSDDALAFKRKPEEYSWMRAISNSP
jgi:hypothetical protein